MYSWNGAECGSNWTQNTHFYPATVKTAHCLNTALKSIINLIFITGQWVSLTGYSRACVPIWPLSYFPSPTLHYFSPAWSHSGWLILLSPCSVIQIWKVNNKLTSLRLYTGVTHSFGYRTHGNMCARHIPCQSHNYSIASAAIYYYYKE